MGLRRQRVAPPGHVGVMNRLDHRGHGPIAKWSDDRVSYQQAEKVFREHQAKGFTMFDISPGRADDETGDGVLLKTFDPAADEILAVPRMQAG